MNHGAKPVIEIREPTPADADAVGRMHYQAWVEAYTPLFPPAFWSPATEQRWLERWRRNLTTPSDVLNRIALRDGVVVGIASTGPSRPNDTAGPPVRDIELYAIYALASEHGTGLAGRLLEAVLPAEVPAELWVFEENPRARAFSAKHAFTPDGARHTFGQELGNRAEIRLVR